MPLARRVVTSARHMCHWWRARPAFSPWPSPESLRPKFPSHPRCAPPLLLVNMSSSQRPSPSNDDEPSGASSGPRNLPHLVDNSTVSVLRKKRAVEGPRAHYFVGGKSRKTGEVTCRPLFQRFVSNDVTRSGSACRTQAAFRSLSPPYTSCSTESCRLRKFT